MKRLWDLFRSRAVALAGRFSRRWYWELRARDIDTRWRHDTHDHELLGRLIDELEPRRLLDVGCGAGRLFPVYLQHGVSQVVGQDISRRALARAGRRFPQPRFAFTAQKLEQLRYPHQHFDLCVCNRALSALSPQRISDSLRAIASLCRHLYLNEYDPAEGGSPSDYWFAHDYLGLLGAIADFTVLETGRLDRERYYLIRFDSPSVSGGQESLPRS